MRRLGWVWVVGAAATLAACGSNVEQSAATGGLGGAAIGAAAGGPVGAAIGLGAGAVAGTGVEMGQQRGVIPNEPGGAQQASAAPASRDDVRRAQVSLRDQGLYNGPIDGIAGPKTQAGLREFQHRQGLQETAQLDSRTRDALSSNVAALPPERGPRAPANPPPR